MIMLEYGEFKSLLQRVILVPLVVTVVLAGLLMWETYDLNRAMQWVEHTDLIIDQSEHLLQSLIDMESGTRGYIVTGDPSFVEPYFEGRDKVESEYQALYLMVRPQYPQQKQRLKEFYAGYVAWNAYASQIIDLRRAGKANPTLYENVQGKRKMDALREQILEFQSVEIGIRSERMQTAHLRWMMMVVSCLILCLGFGVSLAIGQQAAAEPTAMDSDFGQHWRGCDCNRRRGPYHLPESGCIGFNRMDIRGGAKPGCR
jgi:CHASE3 domain sensor protein